MKHFEWNKDKNEELKEERDISFDEIVDAIKADMVLDTFDHPNQKKYPGQKVYIVQVRDYCYFVPYVEDDKKKFLKTVYPDHELTKKYLKRNIKK